MSKAAELAALIGSQTALSNKNILINGAMQVAQRGTSLAMAHDGVTGGFAADRFINALGGTHEQLDATLAQVADHPLSANGKSLKWTTGTAESSYDSDEYVYIAQKVEAQNLQHLNFGNSNAKPVTLSFYVKSSVTGTFACNLYKADSTARIINKTYTISSANTWEKKSITFPADTDSGAGIANDNGLGFYVTWHLSAGSGAKGGGSNGAWKNYGGLTDWADGQATNAVVTTASATWQITDCQLEVGEQATPFEHRSFADELYRCKRYYQKSFNYATAPENSTSATNVSYNGGILGYSGTNNNGALTGFWQFSPEMRATPTVTKYGNSSSQWGYMSAPNSSTSWSASSGYLSNTKASGVNFGQNISGDTHIFGFGHMTVDAEL